MRAGCVCVLCVCVFVCECVWVCVSVCVRDREREREKERARVRERKRKREAPQKRDLYLRVYRFVYMLSTCTHNPHIYRDIGLVCGSFADTCGSFANVQGSLAIINSARDTSATLAKESCISFVEIPPGRATYIRQRALYLHTAQEWSNRTVAEHACSKM